MMWQKKNATAFGARLPIVASCTTKKKSPHKKNPTFFPATGEKQKPVFLLDKRIPVNIYTPSEKSTPQTSHFADEINHLTSVQQSATIPYGIAG